ncbi:MAG: type II toxin-antitoxin system RelE/ParE family toxin [Ruminococcus sp.]|nr:type II toxin-antitoxin system RelE/ParE family toxin [Ruminococcus sp.]MBQ3462493.1 type II toxin-antitoxin system RelE/ParE family toxin [Clostridia bacterium]
MEYSVRLTSYSIFQIQETISYISKVLLVPETATAWSGFLEKQIAGLNIMPARFPLVDIEPWRTNGIRRMPVKNFIVYYYVEENAKEVWITSVVYSKRNQLNALKEMPENQ